MAKNKPVQIRFEEETASALDALAQRTRLTQSELVRRAVNLALQRIVDTGSVGFLFEDSRAPAAHKVHPDGRAGLGLNERPRQPSGKRRAS